MPIIDNSTAALAIINKNKKKIRDIFDYDKMTTADGKKKIEKLADDLMDVMLDLIKNIQIDIQTGLIS